MRSRKTELAWYCTSHISRRWIVPSRWQGCGGMVRLANERSSANIEGAENFSPLPAYEVGICAVLSCSGCSRRSALCQTLCSTTAENGRRNQPSAPWRKSITKSCECHLRLAPPGTGHLLPRSTSAAFDPPFPRQVLIMVGVLCGRRGVYFSRLRKRERRTESGRVFSCVMDRTTRIHEAALLGSVALFT